MGRPLGAYDGEELDRPDLNKCPDCGCYFATETCTLCGKICPEEMRAGNRAAVKHKKRRSGGYSGRVQFVPWYHTWWFIALMLWWMFPVGAVLFFTSPYSRKTKIILTAVAVVAVVAFYGGAALLMDHLSEQPLVNDDISRAAYIERCTDMDADTLYRHVYDTGAYVTMELTITRRAEGMDDGTVYYICTDMGGGEISVLLQDCILEGRQNYRAGDAIRVFGESAGMLSVALADGGTVQLPGLYVAYADLVG